MIDFLRANTWCSREEYLWQMTVGQIRLSSFDFSHVDSSDRKKGKRKGARRKPKGKTFRIGNLQDAKNLTDLGVPIL